VAQEDRGGLARKERLNPKLDIRDDREREGGKGKKRGILGTLSANGKTIDVVRKKEGVSYKTYLAREGGERKFFNFYLFDRKGEKGKRK